MMPVKSKAQFRAMQAAAHGRSTLGIPASVGKDFADSTSSKRLHRLPSRVEKGILRRINRPRSWREVPANFNATAGSVYKAMCAMDEGESQLFGALVLQACNNYDLMNNYVEVAKAAEAEARARAEQLRSYYSRTAVSKERRGEDNTREIAYLVEIGKAFDFTYGQRQQYSRQNAANRQRDPGGRFAQEHRAVHTQESKVAMEREHAENMGIPHAPNLYGNDLSHYQQAYQQIRDMLSPYRNPDLNAQLHLHTREMDGYEYTHVMPVERGATPNIQTRLNQGTRITSASVSVDPAVTPSGGVYMGVHGMGIPPAGAANAAEVYSRTTGEAMPHYIESSGQGFGENEPYSRATRGFGHLERGSKLLQESLGPVAPPKLQYALAVANHVGQFGPEAQKVIGPFADRTAYRYRGTERAPSRKLMASFANLRNNPNVGKTPNDRRNAMVNGLELRPGEWDPMPVLNYFHSHLPNPDLNELQRRSGVIPPSEGIIINREGGVQHQSVGFADDWYLPFNLKHLSNLKGGEYIRTRTFGGPTTEDIYTGLVSGARSLTVVSHNGVYNVEFDRNLRGGRRFNDKAAKMVARYGQLLDAARSGQVSRGDISGSRMNEIRDTMESELSLKPGSPEYRAEMDRRRGEERMDPKLSAKEKNAAAEEWMSRVGQRLDLATGGVATVQQFEEHMITRYVNQKGAQAAEAVGGGFKPDKGALRREAYSTLIDPNSEENTARNIATFLGPRSLEGFERHMKRAEMTNAERIHPLQLNGRGYDDALHALQEQFPYFIHKVTYRPWNEAIGQADQEFRGRADTGYVLPRHNRPHAAESGYFAPEVYGESEAGSKSGKVKADTTRYQNRRVYQGKVRAVPNAAGTPGTPGTPGAPGGRGTGLTAANATPEQRQSLADHDMLDELWEKKTFEQGAKLTGLGANGNLDLDLSNRDIRNEIKQHPSFPSGAIKDFYGHPSKAAIEAKLDNPAEADQIRRMMDELAGHAEGPNKLFVLKPSVVQNYRNKGVARESTALPDDPSKRLDEIGQDHTYGGLSSLFRADSMGRPDAVKSAYENDALIGNMLRSGRLPEITDPQFESKLTAAAEALRSEISAHRRAVLGGNQFDPAAPERHRKDSEAILRADQLHRRHGEAERRVPPPAPAPPAPAPPVNQVENHLHLQLNPADLAQMTPQELQAFLDKIRNAGGGPAAIGP
jgi:hypothetical protein